MKTFLALLSYSMPIICGLLIAAAIGVTMHAAQREERGAPDFESITWDAGVLTIVDKDVKTIKLRTPVNHAVHWLPGQHPEQRPWHAIEVLQGTTRLRLDCKEADDAELIFRFLFQGTQK